MVLERLLCWYRYHFNKRMVAVPMKDVNGKQLRVFTSLWFRARVWKNPHPPHVARRRSEEHTSALQSLMRISYAVFCLKKKNYLANAFPTLRVLSYQVSDASLSDMFDVECSH